MGTAKLVTLFLLKILFLVAPSAGVDIHEAPVRDFINLGYVLKPVNSFYVTNAMATMLFSFDLPDQTPSTFQNTTRDCTVMERTDKAAAAGCIAYLKMYEGMKVMKLKAELHMGRIIDLAYKLTDTLATDTRSKRSYPGWLASIFSSITGLATSGQLESLQLAISKMQDAVGNTAQTFAINQDHIAATVKLQNDRLDAIQSYSVKVKEDMSALAYKIATSGFEQDHINEIQLHIAEMILKTTFFTNDLDNLYEALQRLFSGNISPHLVPHETMEQTLDEITSFLNKKNPHLEIVHKNPLYYYRTQDFIVFRQAHTVFIQVECALSSLPYKFIIYKLDKIPLLTPGSEGFYTILDTPIKALAITWTKTHYITFLEEAEIVAIPKFVNLNQSPLLLRDINHPTCETALWNGNVDRLHTHCAYHVVKGPIPAQIIRLSTTSIFVSNLSKLIIECDDQTVNKSQEVAGRQMVLNTYCGCDIIANEIWLPRKVRSCNNTRRNFTVNNSLHAINYMYLRQFLADDLRNISPNVLYKEQPNITLPELQFNQLKYDQLLAISDKAKYDLLTVVNATKSDKQAFHSIGDLAMQQIFADRIEGSNFGSRDWSTALLSSATVILTIVVAYLYFKLNAMSALIIMSQGHIRTQAAAIEDNIVLRYTTPMTTTQNIYSLLELKDDIVSNLPVEIIMLISIICLIIITVGYLAYKLYHKNQFGSQTKCIIQIGNLTQYVNITWAKLLYPADYYKVHIKQSRHEVAEARIFNHNWPISKARIQLVNIEIKIANPTLEIEALIELKHQIGFFSARKAINISQEPYYIAILLVDNHNTIKSCTKLRSMELKEAQNTPPLYPMIANSPF